MSMIIFHNPGELDIRGATTMGLSAKVDESSAIGKFGTGLKYAIASILRWNGAIAVETGGKTYTFEKRSIDFRGKAHEQIIMTTHNPDADDVTQQELGYTTHYGSHWEPWQIFRELYSNAKDEGGGCCRYESEHGCFTSDCTIIRVICPEVVECYFERGTIILDREGDATSLPYVRVIKVPSNFLYYRNVRVQDEKCLNTWNLTDNCSLTEDRTLADSYYYIEYCAQTVQASTDKNFIRKMLTASEIYFEGGFSYTHWNFYSEQFVEVAEELWKANGTRNMEPGVMAILGKARPYVEAPPLHIITKLQQSQLDKARAFLRAINMPVDSYELQVVGFQKNTLGMAKDGKVWLSPAVFEQGTKQVVSTWYEELLHLSTGLKDNTYEMQTYLFNRIISLHEELLGEAI